MKTYQLTPPTRPRDFFVVKPRGHDQWTIAFAEGGYSLCSIARKLDEDSDTYVYKLYNASHKPIGLSSYDFERFGTVLEHPTLEDAQKAFARLYVQVERRANKYRRDLLERIKETRKQHDAQITVGREYGFVIAKVWDYQNPEHEEQGGCNHITMVLDPRDAIAALLTDGLVIDISKAQLTDGMSTFECWAKWTGRNAGNETVMYQIGTGADGLSTTLARWEKPAN